MLHLLPLLSTTDHILAIIRAHAGHNVERLVGYTLIAHTLDREGRLRSIAVRPHDQDQSTTDSLLAEGPSLLKID